MNNALTDKQNNDLCTMAYSVDHQKYSKPIRPRKKPYFDTENNKYEVISTEDDQETGFQGMAVAP
ncbi:hypothetical protein [Fructilactobacillus florum]|uniref:hypothetical protein n=1 Tax=Fructilactobacillus florum TaxID=640331 RepID=UPI0006D1B785|nr:hypothetical protein [Fructilactobacillus florum]